MSITEKCTVCSSEESSVKSLYSKLLRLPEIYSIKECGDCNLIRLSPTPDQDESSKHYDDSEYYSPDIYKKRAKIRTPFFLKRLAFISKYTNGKKILDFGCGGGDFLSIAKDLGYDCFGVEPTIKLAQSAKEKIGERIFGSLSKTIESGIKFNCVHSNHSFEHVLNPYAVSTNVSKVLVDDGIFILEVPHQFTSWQDQIKLILYKVLGRKISNKILTKPVDSLHHNYFYTPKTLKNILVSTGFMVVYISTINKAHYKNHKPFIKKITYFLIDHFFSFFDKGPVIVCVAKKLNQN